MVCYAQERNQTITEGIKLLGQTQDKTRSFLQIKGFKLIQKNERVEDYLKVTSNAICKFTTVYKNRKSTVISWSENLQSLTATIGDLRLSGFEALPFNRLVTMYSFKSTLIGVLITLIVKESENQYYITISRMEGNTKGNTHASVDSITSSFITIPNDTVVASNNKLGFSESDNDSKSPYRALDIIPEYKYGLNKLHEFILKNLKYPSAARNTGIEGKVIVKFVIGENGNLINFTILRRVGYGCDEEAIRLIKLTSPWNPAKLDGKPVKCEYSLPIIFSIKN